MSFEPAYHLNLVVDELTNSIRQIDDGKSYATEIFKATKKDVSEAIKKNSWNFSWPAEFRQIDRNVYKLVRTDSPHELQGLISLSDFEDHVYVRLAESAPINFGPQKIHEGVGGNLFAYACKRSWDNGNDGIVAFQAKTKLIKHYQDVLGAIHIGGHQMIIYPEPALILIKQYFKS